MDVLLHILLSAFFCFTFLEPCQWYLWCDLSTGKY